MDPDTLTPALSQPHDEDQENRETATKLIYLPPEIIHHILQNLPRKDLFDCCLISRSWSPVAQRLLLSAVQVKSASPSLNSLRRFQEFVVANPIPASYVLTANVDGGIATSELLPLIAKLPSLQSLTLRGLIAPPPERSLVPDASSSSPSQNISIRKLTLKNPLFPNMPKKEPWATITDILRHFTSIHTFCLRRPTAETRVISSPATSHTLLSGDDEEGRKTQVKYLVINLAGVRHISKLPGALLDCLDMKALKSITYGGSLEEMTFLQDFLVGAVGLRELVLIENLKSMVEWLTLCTPLSSANWIITITAPPTDTPLSSPSHTPQSNDHPDEQPRRPSSEIDLHVSLAFQSSTLTTKLDMNVLQGDTGYLLSGFQDLKNFRIRFALPSYVGWRGCFDCSFSFEAADHQRVQNDFRFQALTKMNPESCTVTIKITAI